MDRFENKAAVTAAIATYSSKLMRSDEHALVDFYDFSEFVNQFYQNISFEELKKADIELMSFQVEKAWNLIQKRSSDMPLIVFDGASIYLHNDNRSFLVDSVTSELQRLGYVIDVLIHPVIKVIRDVDGNLCDLYKSENSTIEECAENIGFESLIYLNLKVCLDESQQDFLRSQLLHVLKNVSFAVDDYQSMRQQSQEIAKTYVRLYQEEFFLNESLVDIAGFLNWLDQDNFIFLGSRYFTIKGFPNPAFATISCDNIFSENLGIFRDLTYANHEDLAAKIVQNSSEKSFEFPSFFSIMKTKIRSVVHRPSRMNSFEILDIDEQGSVLGVYQFVGMFTRSSFSKSPFSIPILQKKVQKILNRFGFPPQWHNGKLLISILNSVPQDELFQITENELYDLCAKVMQLKEQVAVFIHEDNFSSFSTIMIYLPRDRYSFGIKEKFENYLSSTLKENVTSSHVYLSDFPFARLIFVSDSKSLNVDCLELAEQLDQLSLSWVEQLIRHSALFSQYQKTFPIAYQEAFSPSDAIIDFESLRQVNEVNPIRLRCFSPKDAENFKVNIFHLHQALPLSSLLPILENLGLKVLSETSYLLKINNDDIWLHSFEFQNSDLLIDDSLKQNITEAFYKVWAGEVENDSFNQLILTAGLTYRDVIVIRAYTRALRQMRFQYSTDYVAAIFSRYPKITKMLVSFFKDKFKENQQDLSSHLKQIYEELRSVSRIDDDRIIRRFLNILQATLRTNYYQNSFGSYLSFKFDSMLLDSIPEPKPLFEIFIYSPRFEACHLRGGKVSRGGIRWSDRAEDFRDEVLGLMKAQMVKNSIIVPLGSKGGFFVKNYEHLLMQGACAEVLRLEVISCYRLMMEGLLGLTDNLINGKIVKPIDTVCYDNDDPYLVVAADKGTATFSDTANSVSRDYEFWLSDAFASGGSYGYDHKKIAITARGAFVSIDRHFRELDFDIYSTPFTAIGVGDMAGDVFGNGMLQTDKIKLIAAFNHQHIFLDPNPDAETSYCERKRLFDLPNSKWSDYDPSCLSKGGGVFDRSLKIIPLSFEVRSFLSAAFHKEIPEELSPDELISYLIKAPIDLLWFGGIGTFIKESHETHVEVGDHQNDRVRVNAKDINARVVGEGANLAMTQRARIEYALKGGKINTDAIDNSAGVDCSDHEVNLKILFSTLLAEGRITFEERNQLLKSMTDDVTNLILQDNKLQTQILSIMERLAVKEINTYQALIRNLESDPYYPLNRALEFLPEDDVFERRLSQKQSLTRPELAILLSYSKISLYQRILDSGLPENSYFDDYLICYFPKLIQSSFASEIKKHPLRHEIVATVLSNQLINRVGPEFVFEISQVVGVSIIEVLDAFICIVRIFNLDLLWDEVENIQSLEDRYKTLISIKQGVEQCVVVFLRHKVSCHLDECFSYLGQSMDVLLTEFKRQNTDAEFENYKNIWPILLDIACEGLKDESQKLISACLEINSVFGFENMSSLINSINVDSQWQKAAKVSLVDDLIQSQAQLTKQIVAAGGINEWKKTRQNMIDILQQNSRLATNDFAFLSYSVRQLQRLF